MKPEECSRDAFVRNNTQRGEKGRWGNRNQRPMLLLSSDLPCPPPSLLPSLPNHVPSRPSLLLESLIFIFPRGDKFYFPRDTLVFLSGEISHDAPSPSLVAPLLCRTWNSSHFPPYFTLLSQTSKSHAVKKKVQNTWTLASTHLVRLSHTHTWEANDGKL